VIVAHQPAEQRIRRILGIRVTHGIAAQHKSVRAAVSNQPMQDEAVVALRQNDFSRSQLVK
jgi:hypothetical protein